jgi:DNA repair protein RecO (recombination protein O)
MTRDRLHPAYILHRRDYGDTSLLLEVLTAPQGRLPLIAKGARRVRKGASATSAALQPFVPLLIAWTGRGEVKTLTRSEPAGPALSLRGDALYCGFYVNELLDRLLCRSEPEPILFAAYQQTLGALSEGAGPDMALRRFELTLLGQIGYRPPLARDAVTGEPVLHGRRYRIDPERGPVSVAEDSVGAGTVSGATLLALESGEDLPRGQLREARDLLRRLLAPHLGTRPLMSRALFAARPRG